MKPFQMGLAALAGACAMHAGSVHAGDVSAGVIGALAGDWLVAPEDGRAGCQVRLGTEAAIGGYAIALGDACVTALPEIAGAAAWRISEAGLSFADATRKTILTFAENEDATYATPAAPGKRLLLTKAPENLQAVPNAAGLFGVWRVIGPGGKAICSLVFSDQPPPGGEESYGLGLAEGCHQRLTRLNLASWRIEGLRLMLYGSDGERLAFMPADGGFIEDQAANGKPMRLARP